MVTQPEIPIQPLIHPLLLEKGIELSMLRLDLIPGGVSGNKFFKLKYHLDQARKEKKETLLSFGGAYSNHLYALAEAGKSEGFHTIGLVRGQKMDPLNPTLAHVESLGMELHFIDRTIYRNKTEPEFLSTLKQFGNYYLIPEGGTNELAIKGIKEIIGNWGNEFSHISVSVGTGGTFAGLAASISVTQKLLGVSALKGEFIHSSMNKLLLDYHIFPKGTSQIFNQYHFGGYGKYTSELITFILDFYHHFGIVLDPIYTGKMVFAIWDLIKKNWFEPNSKILLIHTGGIQGNRGFTKRTGISLPNS
jgi:1-aminocyclopropane-1-carboxylate deaminase